MRDLRVDEYVCLEKWFIHLPTITNQLLLFFWKVQRPAGQFRVNIRDDPIEGFSRFMCHVKYKGKYTSRIDEIGK